MEARNRLLLALNADDLALLASHLSPVSLNAREPLETPGAEIEHCYFVEQGVISVRARSPGSRRVDVGRNATADGRSGTEGDAAARRRAGRSAVPGRAGIRRGGLLAVSPDVSLRVQFLVQHSGDFEQDGQKLPGLGFTAGIVTFGGAVSLSDSVVLDLELGAGLTRDAPDFTAAVSVPIRF